MTQRHIEDVLSNHLREILMLSAGIDKNRMCCVNKQVGEETFIKTLIVTSCTSQIEDLMDEVLVHF